MEKIRKYTIIILLGVSCIFVSCNRPIPFEKERWTQWQIRLDDEVLADPSVKFWGACVVGSHFLSNPERIRGRSRYRMALWLEKNYDFSNMLLDEVVEKFFVIPDSFRWHDSIALARVKNEKRLMIVTRHYSRIVVRNSYAPLFRRFMFFPTDSDWLEFHFDENLIVSRVYSVHFGRRARQATRRRIEN